MIPEKVLHILETNNLTAREFAPGSTPTSELAAQQLGVTVGQIAKSMVLKAKTGDFFLIICPGARRICSKKAKQAIHTHDLMLWKKRVYEEAEESKYLLEKPLFAEQQKQ